jgi:DNA polymerase-3 subunit gamma/tau
MPAPSPVDFPNFDSLVTHLKDKGAAKALTFLRQLRLVEYESGRIVYETHNHLVKDFRKRLREELSRATARVWILDEADTGGQRSQADAEAEAEAALKAHPMVQAAMSAFPDAKLTIGRPAAPEAEGVAEPAITENDPEASDDNPDVVYDDDFHSGDWEPDD